jgi:hypothetical protein
VKAKTYASPAAFKRAMEDRLKSASAVEGAARGFIDPLLGEVVAARWEPTAWSWGA